jgi:hypothetical protein
MYVFDYRVSCQGTGLDNLKKNYNLRNSFVPPFQPDGRKNLVFLEISVRPSRLQSWTGFTNVNNFIFLFDRSPPHRVGIPDSSLEGLWGIIPDTALKDR